MTDKLFNIIVFFSLLLDIAVRNYSYMFPQHFYYTGEAILILSIASFLYYVKDTAITFLVFMLALNNLCDELFFNPKELSYNELSFAVIAIAMLILRRILKINLYD